jgi:hypothetical protein
MAHVVLASNAIVGCVPQAMQRGQIDIGKKRNQNPMPIRADARFGAAPQNWLHPQVAVLAHLDGLNKFELSTSGLEVESGLFRVKSVGWKLERVGAVNTVFALSKTRLFGTPKTKTRRSGIIGTQTVD